MNVHVPKICLAQILHTETKKKANLGTSKPIKEKSTTKTLPFLSNAYEAEAIIDWLCDADNYDADWLNITGSLLEKKKEKAADYESYRKS